MTLLIPCPFCGHPTATIEEGEWNGEATEWIQCGNPVCGAAGPVGKKTRNHVISARNWNRRAPVLDLDSAIVLIVNECVTVGKAAELCGLRYFEMEDVLKARGIRWKE